MKEKSKHHFKKSWLRSLVKTVTYRIIIIILNFIAVYLLTSRMNLAIDFTLISIVYLSIAYYVHERIWARLEWGRIKHR